MKRFFLLWATAWLLAGFVQAQKVGVVLSGGAAKGIAHVGVLKALEEYEIPIDYVVGTSMGGIIGGCYAAGMSPNQIEEMVLSPEFLGWVNGSMEEGFNYYFNKPDDNSSFLKINLSLDSSLNVSLNTSIANDLSLNFALAEKMAQPSAIARNNFDSLFVPLRVVASDIFTQEVVVLKDGALSNALRATQTVPFFYHPIRVNGRYLFDGGVYNNFPVDVAQQTFNPDVIIGCNVSSKVFNDYPYGQDEDLISKSLLYMLLDKSDPGKIPATGVYIQPNIDNYTAFDFGKARALIDSGYSQTVRQMTEIKQKVSATAFRSCEWVAARRNAFNNRNEPIKVERIAFDGFNTKQQQYINRIFNRGRRPLYLNDVKKGYYRLVTDSYFQNIYPYFDYDTVRHHFLFHLNKRPQNNFQVDFGGVIATRNISNIYLGLNYYYFNRALTHGFANFYAGNFYKSAQLKARIDLPTFRRFYLEPETTFNTWDFLEGREIVLKDNAPTILRRIDRKVGLNVGIPLGTQFKIALHAHYINNSDRYLNYRVFVSTDTLDILRLNGARLGLSISSNTLNRKQYASLGKLFSLKLDWFGLNESYEPGNTSAIAARQAAARNWFRGRLWMEQYFKKSFYSTGYLLEGVLSNQPVFTNYQGTIINAPGFLPLQDSRTLLLQNFRSFNYVAGGIRNVFTLRKSLDFRLEGYLFKPLEAIVSGDNQEARLNADLTRLYFTGTAGLVLHSSLGPISLSLNYYDDPENQLGVLLHVGFLLFHKSSLD
ncbi:MAG: patatin-like phospholipase family protein [Bacteroidota bacterium]